MRAVIQRVTSASVLVEGQTVGAIGRGLLVLLGVARDDQDDDRRYIVNKIRELRIFEDDDGKMNRSVADIGGEVLVVSQFTLLGDARRGRRPSFDQAAPPELAKACYEAVVEALGEGGLAVRTGIFRAMMQVELINDGPVTLLIDSRRLF